MELLVENIAKLTGERWLTDDREQAAARFAALALPTESDEDWRYSRINDLRLEQFQLVDPSTYEFGVELSVGARVFANVLGERSSFVHTRNGAIVAVVLSDAARSSGVTVTRVSESASIPVVVASFRSESDAFSTLSDAYFADAVVIEVPPGIELAQPIVVVHEIADVDSVVVFPRVYLSVGESARAHIVECWVSDESRCLVVPNTAIDIRDNANVAYEGVQMLGARSWQLGTQQSRVARDARYRSFVTALGGEYARLAIDSRLVGEGADSQLFAVYFGDREQMQDFRTFQYHSAPHTKSELVFKGAVAGAARSVYSGMIRIDPGAVKSDASQTNRNLVLSEDAHADSVPNLDIAENDVRCTHASAVGPIDPEQRFYLETRGVPEQIADRLILLGFFNDLFDRAPSPAITSFLKGQLAQRLVSSTAKNDDSALAGAK